MTDQNLLLALKYRYAYEQWVNQMFIRLTPEIQEAYQKVLNELNYGNVNWWCKDCCENAMRYLYQQVDLEMQTRGNQTTHNVNTNTTTK
jgi:hypothetical protein